MAQWMVGRVSIKSHRITKKLSGKAVSPCVTPGKGEELNKVARAQAEKGMPGL